MHPALQASGWPLTSQILNLRSHQLGQASAVFPSVRAQVPQLTEAAAIPPALMDICAGYSLSEAPGRHCIACAGSSRVQRSDNERRHLRLSPVRVCAVSSAPAVMVCRMCWCPRTAASAWTLRDSMTPCPSMTAPSQLSRQVTPQTFLRCPHPAWHAILRMPEQR